MKENMFDGQAIALLFCAGGVTEFTYEVYVWRIFQIFHFLILKIAQPVFVCLIYVHAMYLEGYNSQGPPHILTHSVSVVLKSVYLHLDGLLGNVY